MKIKVDPEILFYAFRYAVGRRTYVVEYVYEHLKSYWHFLDVEMRKTIKREIRERKPDGLGMECDKKLWLDVLTWEEK